MNDLLTKSFQSYVELKKQAGSFDADDLEAGGVGLTGAEEENLSRFFAEIEGIQSEMGDVSGLLVDLRILHEESRGAYSGKLLRGLRDRMDADVAAILRKANAIKTRLGALDRANAANRALAPCFAEGSPVDRTRTAVTAGVRARLREMMSGFLALRETILAEHKESLKRRYYNATGEAATEEVLEKMLAGRSQVGMLDDKGRVDMELLERHKAVSDIQRSLTRLHQIFLDMAILVEAQEEKLDDIEANVVRAKDYISGGTDRLKSANDLSKRRRKCELLVWALIAIVILVCLIPLFASL